MRGHKAFCVIVHGFLILKVSHCGEAYKVHYKLDFRPHIFPGLLGQSGTYSLISVIGFLCWNVGQRKMYKNIFLLYSDMF